MERRESTFRVYRVLAAVKHLNLLDVEADRLYTVYQAGYPEDLQPAVDDLATGDLIAATVEGDPAADEEAWRLVALDRVGGVAVAFATGVDRLPRVAREVWATVDPDDPAPAGRPLGTDDAAGPVGECWVQPRAALPDGAFVEHVLAGVVPLEPWFESLPYVGEPTAELLVVDPDEPGEPGGGPTAPYGVLLFFTAAGRDLADRYRARWGLDRGTDTRPDVDPYRG